MSQKNGILWENGLPSNSYKIQKLGVFWKIYDIGYTMGTKIFKIEEEMTEKMKPKVANPPLQKSAEFTAHIMHSFDAPLHFHDLQ